MRGFGGRAIAPPFVCLPPAARPAAANHARTPPAGIWVFGNTQSFLRQKAERDFFFWFRSILAGMGGIDFYFDVRGLISRVSAESLMGFFLVFFGVFTSWQRAFPVGVDEPVLF